MLRSLERDGPACHTSVTVTSIRVTCQPSKIRVECPLIRRTLAHAEDGYNIANNDLSLNNVYLVSLWKGPSIVCPLRGRQQVECRRIHQGYGRHGCGVFKAGWCSQCACLVLLITNFGLAQLWLITVPRRWT